MIRNTFGPKTVCVGVIPNRGYPNWPFQNTSLYRHGQYSWSNIVRKCVIPNMGYPDWPFQNKPLHRHRQYAWSKLVSLSVIPDRGYPDWPFQNIPLHRYGQYSWSSLDDQPLCSPVFHHLD